MKKASLETLPTPQLIPGLDYCSEGASLHFAHANGYPPGAYRLLLNELAVFYHVTAMYQRPLWQNSKPQDIQNWRPLASDLDQFLAQENLPVVIGVGHSFGATTTLRLAIQKPERFSALVLLDPVIFPRWMSVAWWAAMKLGLGMKIHPLAAKTLRRTRHFASAETMFEHYRQKPVFKRMPDESLRAYVESVSRPASGAGVELAYSPEWEAHIYLTACLADLEIWRGLKHLKLPLLIIRGQETDTFLEKTANQIEKIVPQVDIISVPGAGHLLPLENPQAVARIMIDYLGSIPG